MPKRVQDIIPSNRRSIREVPLRDHGAPTQRIEPESKNRPADEIRIHRKQTVSKVPIIAPRMEQTTKRTAPRSSHRLLLGILGIILIVGLLGYFGSAYFARAIFTISPREVPVTVASTLIATSASVGGTLPYELVSINGTASTSAPATRGSFLETKAHGKVTIYNSYSDKSWKLIAGTRLQNSEGLIYRLQNSISIPGYTKSSNGTITPGTLVTEVIAAEAGDNYNIPRIEPAPVLNVVSYSNNPKYTAIYAKISSAITGGYKGYKLTVEPKKLASTTTELQAYILSKELTNLKNSIPNNFIMFDSAFVSTFSPAEIKEGPTGTAIIGVKGTVYGIIFKKSDLISKLASSSIIQSFKGLQYDTVGLEKLSFKIINTKDFSPQKKNNLIFQIKGNMTLRGYIPIDNLKIKFAGLSLTETAETMRSYAPVINLEKSLGQVVPPWSKIPKDLDKISIVVED